MVHIKAIHAETHGGYGWPRTWKELLVRGIRAQGNGRFKVMTGSKHDLPISPNLLFSRQVVGWSLREDRTARPQDTGQRNP